MKTKHFLLAILTLANTVAFAYVCPHSYQVVNIGDSMDHVRSACGAPTNTTQSQQADYDTMQATEWIYIPNVQGKNQQLSSQSNFNSKLVVEFQNQRVVEIRATVPAYTSIFSCYRNNLINVGDDEYKVRLSCGNPNYIKKISAAVPATVLMTQWTYDFGQYFPKPVFIFKGDKLVDIK